MCDMRHYVDFDPRELCGIKERVRFDVLQELLGKYSGDELVKQCRLHADDLVPKHIIVDEDVYKRQRCPSVRRFAR